MKNDLGQLPQQLSQLPSATERLQFTERHILARLIDTAKMKAAEEAAPLGEKKETSPDSVTDLEETTAAADKKDEPSELSLLGKEEKEFVPIPPAFAFKRKFPLDMMLLLKEGKRLKEEGKLVKGGIADFVSIFNLFFYFQKTSRWKSTPKPR